MMLAFNTCRLVICFLSLLLSATAETVRGTPRRLQEAEVELGTAGNYVILAKTGISTVPDSAITGDIGVSPIGSAAMTGFSLIKDSTDTFSTSSQLTGKAYASDYTAPTPSWMTTAISDMEQAYTDVAGRPNTDSARLNLGAGNLGGAIGGSTAPLTPGVYTFTTSVNIKDDIFFHGSDTDIFIIKTTGNVDVASGKEVKLSGGALAKNIFWQVAGFVNVGTTAHMEGILLVKTQAVFMTGSSLNGRVLTQTACTLDHATIN
jgi:hypothetical protein